MLLITPAAETYLASGAQGEPSKQAARFCLFETTHSSQLTTHIVSAVSMLCSKPRPSQGRVCLDHANLESRKPSGVPVGKFGPVMKRSSFFLFYRYHGMIVFGGNMGVCRGISMISAPHTSVVCIRYMSSDGRQGRLSFTLLITL